MRDYGDRLSPWLPVVCLPGLSRSGRDFDELARASGRQRHRPRRVLAFDYRGRGRSEWDRSSDNYNPLVEMSDVFDGMAALGIAARGGGRHVARRHHRHADGGRPADDGGRRSSSTTSAR